VPKEIEPSDELIVHLSHRIPGRVRFKIPSRRHDQVFFDAVARVLSACEGVSSVTANPLTASILVHHTAPLEEIAAYAERVRLLPREATAAWATPAGRPDNTAMGKADEPPPRTPEAARCTTNPGVEVSPGTGPSRVARIALPIGAAFGVFGLMQLARGKIFAPALSLFWYAAQILQLSQHTRRLEEAWQMVSKAAELELAGAGGGIRAERAEDACTLTGGDLGTVRSFYFHGPGRQLNLRARNLASFAELALSIDNATWMHHLRSGDYSQWLYDCIRDDVLAEEVRRIEIRLDADPAESRSQIRAAIARRYAI
jgi:hypothetical protein